MGIDEKIVHSVQVTNGAGQVNIAFDHGTVKASQHYGTPVQDVISMIDEARTIIDRAELPPELANEVADDLDVIKEQLVCECQRKSEPSANQYLSHLCERILEPPTPKVTANT